MLRAASASTQFVRFPGRAGKTPRLDPSWYDDVELVMLETVPVGIVTRRLVIEEFGVPE